MQMTLNKAYPLSGVYSKGWHYTLISATGPLATLLQSLFVFLLIRRLHKKTFYPFLLSAFYLELLSGVMNFRHANDLGRISLNFHLGLYTVPVVFVLLHSLLAWKIILNEKYSVRFTGWTFLLVLLFSSAWILLNNQFHIVLL